MRQPAKGLQVSEGTIKNVVHQDLKHKSHTFLCEGLRVNADAGADAYVKTLQTVVVKALWIDNVANGGRPHYVF
ncbi:hypothetical protein ACTXT7_006724 [Hymenolepis weldensis]